MKRQIIVATMAAISVAAAAPAIAKPGGGANVSGGASGAASLGTGPGETGATMRAEGRLKSQGSVKASDKALERANVNSALSGSAETTATVAEPSAKATNRRVKSQGAVNADINGQMNASANSALAGAGVTTLTGLTTGLAVKSSAGAEVGTVSEVMTNQKTGAVVGIRVDLAGGGSVVLPATSLSIDGSVVTTSATQF